MTVRDRVAVGVRFLDDELPDWRDRVDVDVLDMSTMDTCVLGQLFGWEIGADLLDEWWSNAPAEEPPVRAGFEKEDESYTDLQAEWLRAITNEPECDGCHQDPWCQPVHYGTCPLTTTNPISEPSDISTLIGRNA
jgi:hypothetical protein